MKKPWLAFVYSLVVPGAGLAYLSQWLAGAVNLCLATLIVAAFAVLRPETSMNYLHYVILVVAAGSAGFAHARATRVNLQNQRRQAS